MENANQYNNSDIISSEDENSGAGERKPKPIRGVGFGNIFTDGIKPKLTPIDGTIAAPTLTLGDNRFSPNNNHGKLIPKKPPPPTPYDNAGGSCHSLKSSEISNSMTDTAPVLPPKPTSGLHGQPGIVSQGSKVQQVVREQAKVLFAYTAQNNDELNIKEGDIINVISKEIEDQGWWKGELNGKVGVFPDNFVQLIPITVQAASTAATQSIESNAHILQKPSRPPPMVLGGSSAVSSATTTPSSEHASSTPMKSLNYHLTHQQQHQVQNVQPHQHAHLDDVSVLSSTPASFLSLNRSKFIPLNSSAPANQNKNDNTNPNDTCNSSIDNITISDINNIPFQQQSSVNSAHIHAVSDGGHSQIASSRRRDLSSSANLATPNDSFTIVDTTSNGDLSVHEHSTPQNTNKLTHLTTQRARGPSSRRPPSALALSSHCRDTLSAANVVATQSQGQSLDTAHGQISDASSTVQTQTSAGWVKDFTKKRHEPQDGSSVSVSKFQSQDNTSANIQNDISPSNSGETGESNCKQKSHSVPSASSVSSVPSPQVTDSGATGTSATNRPSWMVKLKQKTAEKKRDSATSSVVNSSNLQSLQILPDSDSQTIAKSNDSIFPNSNAIANSQSIDKPVASKSQFLLRSASHDTPTGQVTGVNSSSSAASVRNLSSRYSGDFSATQTPPAQPQMLSTSTSTSSHHAQTHQNTILTPPTSLDTNNPSNYSNGNTANGQITNQQQPKISDNHNNNNKNESITSQLSKDNLNTQITINSEKQAIMSQVGMSLQKAQQAVVTTSENQLNKDRDLVLKQQQQINDTNNEITELKIELKRLKDELKLSVQRSELDKFIIQINELKDAMDSQKKAHGTLIKDLINDLAGERKKVATMQIEIDRLQKLTSTV